MLGYDCTYLLSLGCMLGYLFFLHLGCVLDLGSFVCFTLVVVRSGLHVVSGLYVVSWISVT